MADSYYAKKNFVDGVREMDLHLISRLRIDANMRFLYRGPQKPRGRPRLYANKVDLSDLTGFEAAGTLEGEVQPEQAIGFHVNASFAAVNIAKIGAGKNHDHNKAFVFSLASLKHRAFNVFLLDRFMDSFELDSTLIKSHPSYQQLCAYGTIAA